MANSLLKLTVESSEYDAKLKKAAEGIRHLADVAHKSGGDLAGLDKAELDFIKSLGEMETKSRSAAGQVRELESTYKELKVIYDQLNEVEKADEGGKALAASLEQLKQRAQEAKKSLDDASKSLQQNEGEGKKTSGVLEQLASKFTVNIDALKLFNVGLQAAKVALDVAKDAFFASEATVDEWGRTMQSAESLYQGFLTAINNGDISGYLNNMDSIVRAAREAYNAMDTLQTMKTIQSPQFSKQEAENNRIRMMIQTGKWISAGDGRKSPLGLKDGDQLTPAMIRTLERQLQGGMQTIVSLTKNELKQTGVAIDKYYDSLAKQNGMSMKEFRQGTSNWDAFSEKMAGYEHYKKWNAQAQADFARQGGRGNVNFDASNPYLQYKKWGTFRVDKMGENSYNDLTNLIKQQQQQQSQMYSNMGQAYRTMNRAEGITVKGIMGGGSGSGKGGTTTATTYAEDSIAAVQAQLSELNKQFNEVGETERHSLVGPIVELEAKLKQMKDDAQWMKDLAMGKYSGEGDFRNSMKDAASVRFNTTLDDMVKDGKDKAKSGTMLLSDKAMTVVTKQIKDATKPQKKEEKSAVDVMSQMNSGINQIVGGIEGLGITIPEELSGILGGINSMLSVLQGITVLVQGIAAMQEIGTFLGIFHNGGVVPHAANGYYVPGNHYSNDVTPILANAGELILNKAAQGNLASQLQETGLSNLNLTATIRGEQIRLAVNNNGKRTGRGEMVQTNRR